MATLEPLPIGHNPFTPRKALRLEPLPAAAGPTPQDEASPIDTADIVEGRARIADAEAKKRAKARTFRTRESAALSARARKMDAEPVEVDGGWELRSPIPTHMMGMGDTMHGISPLEIEALTNAADQGALNSRMPVYSTLPPEPDPPTVTRENGAMRISYDPRTGRDI